MEQRRENVGSRVVEGNRGDRSPSGGFGSGSGDGMRLQTRARCAECGRVFDLLDEEESSEWFYGHECEETGDDE